MFACPENQEALRLEVLKLLLGKLKSCHGYGAIGASWKNLLGEVVGSVLPYLD
jgi:hypothetical protein